MAWSSTTLTLPVSLLLANSIKFVLSKFYVSLYAVNHLHNMSKAVVKLVAFGVLYNFTSTIHKEIWT